MRFPAFFLSLVLALPFACLWSAPPEAAPSTPPPGKVRIWKDNQSRALEAAMRGYDNGDLILWLKDGRIVRVSLRTLSLEDQHYAVFHAEELAGGTSYAPTFAGATSPAATIPTSPAAGVAPGRPISGAWPSRVALPISSVQCRVISEDKANKKFVYQTAHFEFRSEGQLGQAVMSDVSRIFEATYTMLSQSPWGVLATPEDGKFFRAELFETRGSYLATGAPSNSGGVYLLTDRVFRVPFESLGLKETNRGYIKDQNYGTKTLVHELTHMLHHDVLPLLPIWVVEGMAEYTECIPFRSSTFWVDSIHDGVKNYNKGNRGDITPAYRLSAVIAMTSRDWSAGRKLGPPPARPSGGVGLPVPPPIMELDPDLQRSLYHSGLLLVYYFMHLEGDGKGTRFMQFLETTRKDVTAWRSYQQGFVTYRQQMDEFMRKPGVKDLGGGRFSYPSELAPPQPPREPFDVPSDQMVLRHLPLLLNGKTPEQVAIEAETALKKAGLQLNYR
jgi:hypothetical protein